MEKEEEELPKKETACLFFNFNIKNNFIPLSKEIKLKRTKIKNMCDKMNTEYEKFYIGEHDNYMKNNLKFYKLFWAQYLSPKENKPIKKKKKIKKGQLNTKIYFGTFFNQNSQFDGWENVRKYDRIKKLISKSNNFSFVKDPKTIKFSKLPKDLYLTKEDSIKLRELISVKKISNKNNSSRNIPLIHPLQNNIFNTNSSDEEDEEELKMKIYALKGNKYRLINKSHKKSEKNKNSFKLLKIMNNKNNSSSSILSPLTQNNSTDLSQKYVKTEETDISSNFSKYKMLDKKNKSQSNFSKTNYIYTNLDTNNSYSNLYNHTYNQNFYLTPKNVFYSNMQEKLDKLMKYRTPKKDIKDLSQLTNIKCRNKIKKIANLIKKNSEYKIDPKSIVRLLKETKKNGSKKKVRNQFYYDIGNQIRLLSILDNLKNVKENAPLNLIKSLNEEYYEKSKEMIVEDSVTKKINNIYRSSTEGKKINEKASGKSNLINRLVSKNIMDGVKLKNKYEKCDLLVEEIQDENDIKKNYKMLSWNIRNKNKTKESQ